MITFPMDDDCLAVYNCKTRDRPKLTLAVMLNWCIWREHNTIPDVRHPDGDFLVWHEGPISERVEDFIRYDAHNYDENGLWIYL